MHIFQFSVQLLTKMLSEIYPSTQKQLSNIYNFSRVSISPTKDYLNQRPNQFQSNYQVICSKESIYSQNKLINTLDYQSTFNLQNKGYRCQFFINEDFLIIPKRNINPEKNADSKKLSFINKKDIFFPKCLKNSFSKGSDKQLRIGQQQEYENLISNDIQTKQLRKRPSFLVPRLLKNDKLKEYVNKIEGKKYYRVSQFPNSPTKAKQYNIQYSKSKNKKKTLNDQNCKTFLQSFGPKKLSCINLLSFNTSKALESQITYSPNLILQQDANQQKISNLRKSINNFYIFRILENSQYFQNYQCIDKKTFTIYNLKKINKKKIKAYPSALQELIKRIRIQINSEHSNILRIYDIFSDSDHVYIIEEYMEGGTLREYLNQQVYIKKEIKFQQEIKQESLIVQKLYNINSALNWIHNIPTKSKKNVEIRQDKASPIIHGDLRPQTIFLSFGCCKISLISTIKTQRSYCQVDSYICPEIVAGQKLTYKSDMWNLGLVLFQLCSNRSLFKSYWDQMDMNPAYQMFNVDYNQQITKLFHITQSLKNVMRGLLKLMPDQRMTTNQIANSQVIKIYGIIAILLQKIKDRDDKSQFDSFRAIMNEVNSKKLLFKRMSRHSQCPTVDYPSK